MAPDVSLSWHGPSWYVGRPAPVSAVTIPGVAADVDLLKAFKADQQISAHIPCAIIIDPDSVPASENQAFFAWLQDQIATLASDVPLIYLCTPRSLSPDRPKATAILDRSISAESLFERICDLQRALIRSEEARIRRKVFGRVPGYGTAPHHRGRSGLLVVGFGGRFLDVLQARHPKVELVGAFNQRMAEDYLSQRAFDAVILDDTLDEVLENLRGIRRDSRFASMPVLAVTSEYQDMPIFYEAGASDVLITPMTTEILGQRLASAIRIGKRRRLADRVLAESHRWLVEQKADGGVSEEEYQAYLATAGAALAARGMQIWRSGLLPGNLSSPYIEGYAPDDLCDTVLAIADAISREEDLVCFVKDAGPVAVFKSDRGAARLKKRLNAILGNTKI